MEKAELLGRIRGIACDDVVEEVYRVMAEERVTWERRRSQFDAKAAGLLTSTGVAMSVLTLLFSLLTSGPGKVRVPLPAACALGAAMILGFFAAAFAVAVLWVRPYGSLTLDGDVLNKKLLEDAGRLPANNARAAYRGSLIQPFNEIIDTEKSNHQKRAWWMRRCQVTFLLALLALLSAAVAALPCWYGGA